MHIRNIRPYQLEIAATGQVVEPDEIVDVDPALGASLLEQPDNWQPPRGTPSAERPTDSATKAKWLAYATAQGMASDEAESLTRDELVALFPPIDTTTTDDESEDQEKDA